LTATITMSATMVDSGYWCWNIALLAKNIIKLSLKHVSKVHYFSTIIHNYFSILALDFSIQAWA